MEEEEKRGREGDKNVYYLLQMEMKYFGKELLTDEYFDHSFLNNRQYILHVYISCTHEKRTYIVGTSIMHCVLRGVKYL